MRAQRMRRKTDMAVGRRNGDDLSLRHARTLRVAVIVSREVGHHGHVILNANVAAGHAINNPGIGVSFPTGNSKGEQQARIGALLVTLQNLHGPGVGCPAVASVYGKLQQQINQ